MEHISKEGRIDDLFSRAVKVPSEERQKLLHVACEGDIELLAEVQKLLAAHDRVDQETNFLAALPLAADLLGPTITMVACQMIIKATLIHKNKPHRGNSRRVLLPTGQIVSRISLRRSVSTDYS